MGETIGRVEVVDEPKAFLVERPAQGPVPPVRGVGEAIAA